MNIEGQTGLYIHWPFCLAKCPYCDFNTHVHDHIDHQQWEDAYLTSLEHYAELLDGRIISSIFFGGGTPSLMRPETVGCVIDKVRCLWPCVNDPEITLEANPTSVEAGKFKAFKEAGVNRVSIGVQALNDEDLQFLGRKHSVREALHAIDIAGELFDRFSFDLIYARSDQTPERWRDELKQAITLARGHLSLYQLTIERNTPFHFDYAQGLFSLPDEAAGRKFYNMTQDILEQGGLPGYEVSNHAASGHESRHNLTYWHYGDYIGIGPGAHGRLTMGGQKFATREHHAPQIWLEHVRRSGCGAHPFTVIPSQERFLEALMMGLRLKKGVAVDHLSREGGRDWMSFIDYEKFSVAQNEGWIKSDEGFLSLTREGTLRLNALIPYILKAADPQAPQDFQVQAV